MSKCVFGQAHCVIVLILTCKWQLVFCLNSLWQHQSVALRPSMQSNMHIAGRNQRDYDSNYNYKPNLNDRTFLGTSLNARQCNYTNMARIGEKTDCKYIRDDKPLLSAIVSIGTSCHYFNANHYFFNHSVNPFNTELFSLFLNILNNYEFMGTNFGKHLKIWQL